MIGIRAPVIVSRGIAAASVADAAHQSCCFAHVAATPSGRWLVTYRAARTKTASRQEVLLTWSDDEGRTWLSPTKPFADRVINGKLGQFREMACAPLGDWQLAAALWWVDAADETRSLFNPATEGVLDSRVFLSTSDDGGEHWSEPWPVDAAPFQKRPCAITGPVLRRPNGDWVISFEAQRPYAGDRDVHPTSVLKFSSDYGASWPAAVCPAPSVANRVYFWDQRLAALPDGTLLDLFWTYDRLTAQFRNIHAAASYDGGRSWSAPWDTGVPGQPAPVRAWPDGRLAMVFVDRTGPPAIKFRLSDDGGRTWPAATELVLHQPTVGSQTKHRESVADVWTELQQYSIGFPDTCRLPDGDLLVTYYNGPQADYTNIEWVRVSIARNER